MSMTRAEMRRVKKAREQLRGLVPYWMAPMYGKGGCAPQVSGAPDVYVAFDLDHAFKAVRTAHPSAAGWVCHGVQDPADPEACLE